MSRVQPLATAILDASMTTEMTSPRPHCSEEETYRSSPVVTMYGLSPP